MEEILNLPEADRVTVVNRLKSVFPMVNNGQESPFYSIPL